CAFLIIVRTAVHFPIEFRYLLQIYPFMIIGAALTADHLLNGQRLNSRIFALFIIGLLVISAARSARASILGLLDNQSKQTESCISRIELLKELKEISATETLLSVLTNIQGLTWYSMRIPTIALTRNTLADAPRGTVIIFARPQYICPEVLESEDLDEIALVRAVDVNIIYNRGALLVGKKINLKED